MFAKISKFIEEVKQEGLKVVWPSKKETVSMTIMVIVVSVLVSLIFFLVDRFFMWAMSLILKI